MAQRTWNVKVKGSRIRFAAGGRPRIGPTRGTARRLPSEAKHETPIKYSRPGNRPLGKVPFDRTESRLPPDGVVAATRRKVSRRILHLTTFHRLRIGRSWIGCRGSLRLSHHCDGFRSSLDGTLPV
jgi:hypothetical protein